MCVVSALQRCCMGACFFFGNRCGVTAPVFTTTSRHTNTTCPHACPCIQSCGAQPKPSFAVALLRVLAYRNGHVEAHTGARLGTCHGSSVPPVCCPDSVFTVSLCVQCDMHALMACDSVGTWPLILLVWLDGCTAAWFGAKGSECLIRPAY